MHAPGVWVDLLGDRFPKRLARQVGDGLDDGGAGDLELGVESSPADGRTWIKVWVHGEEVGDEEVEGGMELVKRLRRLKRKVGTSEGLVLMKGF